MIKYELENSRVYADVYNSEPGTKEYILGYAILYQKETSGYYQKYMSCFGKEELKDLNNSIKMTLSVMYKCIPGLEEKIGDISDADKGTLVDIIESFNAEDLTIDEGYLEFL